LKNQYFGDIRDLFKYDLVTELIENIAALDQFTFVPMLTEDDGKGDGGKIDYGKAKAGTTNAELASILKECIHENRRNIHEIKRYFAVKDIKIIIHNEGEYLYQKTRHLYFNAIEDKFLKRSLVFLDPDNGMEIDKSKNKHVLYREIKDLYERMDDQSLLMIYQHFAREPHDMYLKRRSEDLHQLLGSEPIYIHDSEITFFLLNASKCLIEYRKKYPKLEIGNIS